MLVRPLPSVERAMCLYSSDFETIPRRFSTSLVRDPHVQHQLVVLTVLPAHLVHVIPILHLLRSGVRWSSRTLFAGIIRFSLVTMATPSPMEVAAEKFEPTCEVVGAKPYALDSEGKAKFIPIWRFTQPHMMAFHVSQKLGSWQRVPDTGLGCVPYFWFRFMIPQNAWSVCHSILQ
jgi:hypothetical protein